MNSFHGTCTCPHGGQPTGFLWLSTAGATICTIYSIASCRLMTLSFESDLGNFDEHFYQIDPATTSQPYLVAIGLFTWLRPSFYVDGDDDTVTRAVVGNWREGTCAGYTTIQMEATMDQYWEAIRILGVFSVLSATTVFFFSMFLSCLAFASWQRYMLAVACLFVATINGMALLMTQSELCTEFGTGASRCEMDQGSLVAIAAVILWVCSAMLVYFFIEPVQEPGYREKEMTIRRSKQKEAALRKARRETDIDGNSNSSRSKAKAKPKSSDKSSLASQSAKSKSKSTKENNSKSKPAPKDSKPVLSSFSIGKPDKKREVQQSSKRAVAAAPILLEGDDSSPEPPPPIQRISDSPEDNKKDVVGRIKGFHVVAQPQERGCTAGEILIDLRAADGERSPRRKSRNGTSQSSHGRQKGVQPAQEGDLELQPSRNPFSSCDPGCCY